MKEINTFEQRMDKINDLIAWGDKKIEERLIELERGIKRTNGN